MMTIATAATGAGQRDGRDQRQHRADCEDHARKTATGANESAKAVHELSSLATDLHTIVSKFNVGTNGTTRRKPASRPRTSLPRFTQREEHEEETVGV